MAESRKLTSSFHKTHWVSYLHLSWNYSALIIMFVDDHLVSLLTTPLNGVLVPQVKFFTIELNPFTGPHLVFHKAVHACQ